MTVCAPYLDRETKTGMAIGATYEGRDPRLLERILPLVDFIEVTLETISEVTDHGISLSAEIMAELKNMGKAVQIIVHGVGLSIGSHEGWSPTYFRLLDEFLEQVDIAWHSEHLAYTKVDGEHLGIMLAMPKTEEVLDMICERTIAIQERYRLPFLLENVVHVIPDFPSDYTDAAFLNALADISACGLILDVYNLECDAHSHGFDIHAFLNELNPEHIRELHVACGVEHNGFLLDVHSQLTRNSTVDLAKHVVRQARNAEVLVYEFMPEAVPGLGYNAIAEELGRLRAAFRN
jgi:uncharacterized protein (UPF0276 family)